MHQIPERTVLDLARRDHERHVALIDAVRGAKSAAERTSGVARLAADLRGCSRAEETALLSVLLVEPDVRTLAQRAVAHHRELHRILLDVSSRVHDPSAMRAALDAYRARFLEHLRFDEDALHATALIVLGTERCQRLCDRYEVAQRAHLACRSAARCDSSLVRESEVGNPEARK